MAKPIKEDESDLIIEGIATTSCVITGITTPFGRK